MSPEEPRRPARPGRDVAVVGAGVMGLSAAFYAAKAGHRVAVFEHDRVPGGMAAHFDFAGISIERFYHFVCKADQTTFELLAELGIGDRLRWRPTSMGYFMDGSLHGWGDPISLMRLPGLGLLDKLRYGLLAFTSTKRSDWTHLDTLTADRWIKSWVGPRAYEKLWRPLLHLKFFEYADNISAAWIWTRLKRVGTSRRSLMQEELGYIDGGSETLVRALCDAITTLGGEIRLGATVQEICVADGAVTGVRTPEGIFLADRVISTIPTPHVSRLVPALPEDWKRKYDAIPNIGVVCAMFRLKRSVTPHFWVNISDARIDIPGIIEFSRLRPLPDTVVCVPYYMPQTHPKWARDDDFFIAEAFGYLRMINPVLCRDDIVATRIGRLRHAQPVCAPRFLETIPEVVTPIEGLQIADTCYYYPEDRGISESARLARTMAARLD
ncbi:MAG: NAD(P)/FAD-dependent oxidoreductase [Steroidobacteraceae bacterium]